MAASPSGHATKTVRDHESWMYLTVPALLHRFPITPAPGDDYLTVHIRTLGDWPSHLRNLFTEYIGAGRAAEPLLLDGNRVTSKTEIRLPAIFIDGPYSAPVQNYKQYDILLLIGLGSGVTTFFSILKDTLNNIKSSDEVESTHGPEVVSFKNNWPAKAYFYWVTGEQGSFDWRKGLMNEIAERDHSSVIEVHNYLTSVYVEGDARSAFIAMVQSLQHAKYGVDIISRTRTKGHFARPNWRRVFSSLAVAHKNARIGELNLQTIYHIRFKLRGTVVNMYKNLQVYSIVNLPRSRKNSRIFRKNSARHPQLGSISTMGIQINGIKLHSTIVDAFMNFVNAIFFDLAMDRCINMFLYLFGLLWMIGFMYFYALLDELGLVTSEAVVQKQPNRRLTSQFADMLKSNTERTKIP
ncbi:respiratory burst oxidase homolog protein B-like [Aegilops tauschii subsp. strangulata]|uniref:respiratory burst oxidase homolog protein B-like n=1 Tax=Aegilops tauschii subsp. strangulata TaxID=200361 RepID=UPI003CC86424